MQYNNIIRDSGLRNECLVAGMIFATEHFEIKYPENNVFLFLNNGILQYVL